MTTYEHQKTRRRKQQIAAIHVAKQQLGLDEDTYRDLLARESAHEGTPQRSSARMTDGQRRAVLDAMRRLGAKHPTHRTSHGRMQPASYPGKPHNFNSSAMPEMITKIEAQLTDMGLSWAYADAIAKRQCGVARVAWVRDKAGLRGIIAALDVEQKKRARREFIGEAMQQLGMSEKQLAELTAKLPRNWRRQLRPLGMVCEHLQARLEMLARKEGEADAS